ncbi:hypothetical protein DI272_39520 [Streptomyces sp. Act143]|uniref:DUF6059 family protein n=1 Tax=Streptomyces sp. Act143 TaxID=2200760 RepID=UPI000D67939A|nr:DUF6059 family protein [Streptomyces sp. Act143]PWI19576.1 hypothetical protein DI272_39520 [Streptomyces sp. Act143]
MNGLLRGGARWLKNRCLWPLWRSLAAFGAMHLGTGASQDADRYMADAATGSRGFLAGQLWRRLLVLPPGVGGPPPAHPERLRADLPLTAQERLLARDLWPGYEQRVRDTN